MTYSYSVNDFNEADTVDHCMDNINAQYQQAKDLLDQMEKISKEIADKNANPPNDVKQYEQYQAEIESLKAQSRAVGPGRARSEIEAHIEKVQKKMNKLQPAVDKYNADIKSLNDQLTSTEEQFNKLVPGFQAIEQALNSLINVPSMGNIEKNNLLNIILNRPDLVNKDKIELQKMLQQLFVVMECKLETERDYAIVSKDTSLSEQDRISYAAQGNYAASADTQSALAQLEAMVSDAFSSDVEDSYENDIRNANESSAHCSFAQRWSDFWHGHWGSIHKHGAATKRANDETISNAKAMENFLTSLLHNLAPELATISPTFTQLLVTIRTMIHKAIEILENTQLSPREKQEQALPLMMFVLGLFTLAKQDTETEKAANEQRMEQSNIDSSKNNLAELQTSAEIQEINLQNAAFNQRFSKALQIVLGVICVLAAGLSGSVGAMLLMAVVTALSSTGVLSKGTHALAKVLANAFGVSEETMQIIVDVAVAVALGAATAAGGAALDKLAETLVQFGAKGIATAVGEVVEKEMTDMVSTVVEQAAKDGTAKASQAAVMSVAKEVTQQAALKAISAVGLDSCKGLTGILNLMSSTARERIASLIQVVAQKAAQEALVEAENTLKLVVQGAEKEGVIQELVEQAATKGAQKAVNDAPELNSAVAESIGASRRDIFLDRMKLFSASSLLLTNWIVDTIHGTSKAFGADEDQLEIIDAVFQTIQALLLMILMMYGSSGAGSFENKVARVMTHLMTLASLIPQGAQIGTEFSQYEVDTQQGTAVTRLQSLDNVADMLHAFLEQLQKDANLERDKFVQDLEQEERSQKMMSGHLRDGDLRGIQILAHAV